jgi:DNA-binding MurR/RpiR family transcriptional regulator
VSQWIVKTSLNEKQRQAAQIFATNDIHKKTVEQIAEEVGVSTRTLYRWKQDPEFIQYQNMVAEIAMEDIIAEAYAKLKVLMREGKSEKTQLEDLKLILQNRGKLVEKEVHIHDQNDKETQEERERRIIEMERELLE